MAETEEAAARVLAGPPRPAGYRLEHAPNSTGYHIVHPNRRVAIEFFHTKPEAFRYARTMGWPLEDHT